MHILSAHDINLIHRVITDSPEYRDSVEGAYASVDYHDDIKDKIASVVRSLVKGHFFSDGNKRTAFVVFAVLCHLNSITLPVSELEDLYYAKKIEDIAKNQYSVEEVRNILFEKFEE
ncbi:MAG: type II toxin-antitoxin system death-on-curing family toxin [Alphaproteobacteria bacterium]|nr:type II toxin-antitoxin system death-on-curing family toxin [Alphaproteobacteria bacterium]